MHPEPLLISHLRGELPFAAVEGQISMIHEFTPDQGRRGGRSPAVDRGQNRIEVGLRLRLCDRGYPAKCPFPAVPVFPPLRYPITVNFFQTTLLIPPSHDVPFTRLRRQCP